MTKETLQLKTAADTAKYDLAMGRITYDEAVAIVKAYIDHGNTIAKRIAKEFGTRPRLMSVKAYMR